MVKFTGILFFTFVLRLQENYVESFDKVVIVENKQMTYNQKGELVEVNNEKKTKGKPVEIVEKSNIFKNSAFVTKSNFQGATNKFTASGLITKLSPASKPFPPVRSYTKQGIVTKATKQTKISRSSTPVPITESLTTFTPTTTSSIVLDDEISSVQNTLQNSYDEIFKNFYQKYPQVSERPVESTHEKPSVFVYSTATPLTMVPFFVPAKKLKKKKKKLATTTPVPMIEHFMQNIDYYRKILAPNCTHPGKTNPSVVTITPKPKLKLNNPVQTVTSTKKLTPGGVINVIEEADEGKKHKDSHSDEDDDDHYDKDKDKDKHKKKKKKKKKCKKKKKKHKKKKHGDKESGHEYHEHVHHYPVEEVEIYNGYSKEHSKEQSKEQSAYYDAPSGHGFEKAGLFDTFYSFFEDALTSKEFLDYGRADDGSYSESESEYDDESGHHHHRRKRSSTVEKLDNEIKSDDPKARKSMTTKITVTSEYDDSLTGQTTPKIPATVNYQPIKKSTKRPKGRSSEESEEYTFYDEIMAPLQDGFDDSRDDEDDDDRLDSDEYYDDNPPATNRLPKGETLDNQIEDYSDENVAPSGSIFSGVTSMFSTLGGFISSLTGFRTDRSRKPPKRKYKEYDDYDEGRSTTEKVEQLSKRPKRENEPLPWYQPSFLFASDDNDDETAFSSTTQGNWLLSPWNHLDYDENEISPSAPSDPTTVPTTVVPLASTSEPPSYDFFEMFTNYISPKQKSLTTAKPKTRPRRKKYDGYQLWRLLPSSKDEAKFIEEFKMSSGGVHVHWLKGPSLKSVTDVVIAPDFVEHFTELLTDNDIKFDVKVRDIQHAIQFENPRLNKRDQIEMEVIYGHPLTWFRYHPYKDIQSYFDYLKRKFSSNAELIPIGWSFEGRPLTIVKIQHNDELAKLRKEHRSDLLKPAVFIHSGSEAHEWLPIACSTFILNELVTSLDSNSTVTELLKKVDFYFLPVMNPDGYDYSIYYERLWQKTRSQHVPSSGIWSTA